MKKILLLSLGILSTLVTPSSASNSSSSTMLEQPGLVLKALRTVIAAQKPLEIGSVLPKGTYYQWKDYQVVNGTAELHSTSEWLGNEYVTVIAIPRFLSPTCNNQICSAGKSKASYPGLTVYAAVGDADSAATQAQRAFLAGESKNQVIYAPFSTYNIEGSFLHILNVLTEADETKATGGNRFSLLANRSGFGFYKGILAWSVKETANNVFNATSDEAIRQQWEKFSATK